MNLEDMLDLMLKIWVFVWMGSLITLFIFLIYVIWKMLLNGGIC